MPMSGIDVFIQSWDQEAERTDRLLKALPRDKYDFRPDAGGRSIGEMAWHLAELDGCVSYALETGKFDFNDKVPGLERPRTVEALAPGYKKVHADAVARIRKLTDKDLDREVVFFTGDKMPIRRILWDATLHHSIHHRGALALMCRLAGGVSPGIYGPNREEMAAMMAAMKAGASR